MDWLLENDFKETSFVEFRKMTEEPDLLDDLASLMYERPGFTAQFHNSEKPRLSQFKELLGQADKTLFTQFRDGKISYNQLELRVLEKLNNKRYLCVDDLKQFMSPSAF